MTQRLSARETAYQILRSRILNLDLKPNDSLSDKELAAQMGMSRTPIREAVIKLSLANLVVVRPQSGTFVASIDTRIVEMEQFSRYVLEKEMVLQAIPRMTDRARQMYEENLQVYRLYLASHGPDRKSRLFALDNQFHRIAFQLNQKGGHFDWMQDARHHIERVRVLSFLMNLDDFIPKDHEELVAAMSAGDADTAVQILERHLTLYQDHLKQMKTAYPHYFDGMGE